MHQCTRAYKRVVCLKEVKAVKQGVVLHFLVVLVVVVVTMEHQTRKMHEQEQ